MGNAKGMEAENSEKLPENGAPTNVYWHFCAGTRSANLPVTPCVVSVGANNAMECL